MSGKVEPQVVSALLEKALVDACKQGHAVVTATAIVKDRVIQRDSVRVSSETKPLMSAQT